MFNQMKNSLINNKRDWIEMLKVFTDNELTFIKDFGHPYLRLCEGVMHLYRQLIYFGGEKQYDCYLSILSYRMKEKPVYVDENGREVRTRQTDRPVYSTYKPFNKVVLDFDCKDIRKTYEEVVSKVGDISVIYFTGRGLHVYIYTKEYFTDIKECVVIQKKLSEILPEVDKSIFGDITRVVRIPYTINTKNSLQMLPLYNCGKDVYSIDYVTKEHKFEIPDYRKIKPLRLVSKEEIIK